MIEQLILLLVLLLITFGTGMVCGQHSVWRSLRKKGHVTIDEWYYTAVRVKEGQYKSWN